LSLEHPVVITCSISGSLANRDQCPAIPYTPEEYAAEARRIVDEGGVHVHIHARRPDGTPSYEIEDFRAITEAIRAEVGDGLIINYSTGAMGVSVEKRIAYLRELRPDVAALNMGSMNYAKYSAKRKAFVFDAVFANPFSEIIEFLTAMNELGIKPEHECFDVGHVGSLVPLVDMGVLKPPLHVDFVMGVVGGVPPTPNNLRAMADNAPEGSHWGLDGIKVLDLTRLLPGGFCTLLMADFGADIIKVEDTGMGDYVRWSPPFYEGAEQGANSAMFLALNRGKRSIRIDLKTDEGRDVLLRLARDADVLIESFRPGVLDRLGVGWERLRSENPRLVYCAITGYGQDGPFRDRAGHDMN